MPSSYQPRATWTPRGWGNYARVPSYGSQQRPYHRPSRHYTTSYATYGRTYQTPLVQYQPEAPAPLIWAPRRNDPRTYIPYAAVPLADLPESFARRQFDQAIAQSRGSETGRQSVARSIGYKGTARSEAGSTYRNSSGKPMATNNRRPASRVSHVGGSVVSSYPRPSSVATQNRRSTTPRIASAASATATAVPNLSGNLRRSKSAPLTTRNIASLTAPSAVSSTVPARPPSTAPSVSSSRPSSRTPTPAPTGRGNDTAWRPFLKDDPRFGQQKDGIELVLTDNGTRQGYVSKVRPPLKLWRPSGSKKSDWDREGTEWLVTDVETLKSKWYPETELKRPTPKQEADYRARLARGFNANVSS